MAFVVKTNGKRERFDAEKVRSSIKKAVIDAGLSVSKMRSAIEKVTKNVAEMAREKTSVTTRAIRSKILKDFDKIKKPVSNAWRRFDFRYKSKRA